MTADHGRSRYVQGCRCDICRTAAVGYRRAMRARGRARREAAAAEGRLYVAAGIRHGLYAYQTHGCRCLLCRLANAAKHRARAVR